MNFGENLKILRKNKKISQEELAEKVGVTRQSVSKWEVGDAYPEMSNIVALCSIFKCNINDLINDNIVDIESFDKETKEEIVKFKKDQQKKMKGVSKAIYIITDIVKYVLIVPLISLILITIAFPFLAKTFSIENNKIQFLNKEYTYKITDESIRVNGRDYYVDTTTDLNKFIDKHSDTFFRISIEYILICLLVTILLTVLSLHCLSKLYKNIYKGNTPFSLENEKLVNKTILFMIGGTIIEKITALIYMAIAKIDLSIELNLKDLIILLIGISVIYMFKYGRMLQADSKAKIYD